MSREATMHGATPEHFFLILVQLNNTAKGFWKLEIGPACDSQVGVWCINCHAEDTSSGAATHYLQISCTVNLALVMRTYLTCSKSSIKGATRSTHLEELLEHIDNALWSSHSLKTDSCH